MKFWALLIAAAAALAVAASAASGAVRPDDRPGVRGVPPQPYEQAVRPDDRAGVRGVPPQPYEQAVRPDDRAVPRGVDIARADRSDAFTRYVVNNPPPTRPDDRAGVRGAVLGAVAANVETSASGEPRAALWEHIGLGALFGAGAMLVLFAAGYTLRRGGHVPSRPVAGS